MPGQDFVHRVAHKLANSCKFLAISTTHRKLQGSSLQQSSGWEVLNGVGVDRVGGIFPFFSFFFRFSSLFRFFFVFLRFSSFFFAFLRFSPILLGQGQTTAFYWENGESHSDPVCTDPVRNFPIWQHPRIFGGVLGSE